MQSSTITGPLHTASIDSYTDNKDSVAETAMRIFGITCVRPWQRLVIANIMDSAAVAEKKESFSGTFWDTGSNSDLDDVICRGKQIVLLPTGSGKSLCFLLPALLLKGPTLIVYPLLALMADQRRRMREAGITSVVFRGGQTDREREENFRKIKEGTKIILATPEVLQNSRLLDRLSACGISHIAIDEAHCISEWGESFRPAYLTLGIIINRLAVPIVSAFTATASPEVLSRISEVLFHKSVHIIRSPGDRPNIHYSVRYVFSKKKELLRLAATEQRPQLIFCGTRRNAENTARDIAFCYGCEIVRFYHAGMNKAEKTHIEEWYFNAKNAILCATVAFGMGIDKPDIRTVIHLEPSANAESYVQEAGRAGRDGKPARAIVLWNKNDNLRFSRFPANSREHVMYDFCETEACRRQILLDALGDEPAVCSGCDNCDELKKPQDKRKNAQYTNKAPDAQIIYHIIRTHRKCYDKEELCTRALPILNSEYRKSTKVNIWNYSDIRDILEQLEKENKIHTCRFLWKNKIDIITRPAKKTAASVIPDNAEFCS
jgi:ATP-dependent DNA helicase RecQ